jgi:hypothetical protein
MGVDGVGRTLRDRGVSLAVGAEGVRSGGVEGVVRVVRLGVRLVGGAKGVRSRGVELEGQVEQSEWREPRAGQWSHNEESYQWEERREQRENGSRWS